MEFLRRSWTQIGTLLERLDRNAKVAIWSVLIAGILTVFLVMQWAGTAQRIPVSPFSTARQPEVLNTLTAAGIDARMESGQVVVPQDKHRDALFVLQQKDLLREDADTAWRQYLESLNIWDPTAINEKKYLIALQEALGAQIAMNPAVRSAGVTIAPPQSGSHFRRSHRNSATIMITMEGGKRLNKRLAEAAAAAVAGARSNLQIEDIKVVDVAGGRTLTPGGKDLPSNVLEHLQTLENYHRGKIENFLDYIPGVIVAVNAQIDSVEGISRTDIEYQQDASQRVTRAFDEETSHRNKSAALGTRSGAQANTHLDIHGEASTGTSSSRSETEGENYPPQITRKDQVHLSGRTTKTINVTVGVPRSFIVAQYIIGKEDQETEPTDEDLEPTKQIYLTSIEEQIMPLIKQDQPGEIKVAMIPDSGSWPNAKTGSGAVIQILEGGWIKPVGVTALALISLALMLGMVRKATQPPELPSVEELVGVPPTLPVDDNMVRAVGAEDETMVGMEVNEADLKYRKIAEKISDLVKDNPNDAGSLINRWIRTDD